MTNTSCRYIMKSLYQVKRKKLQARKGSRKSGFSPLWLIICFQNVQSYFSLSCHQSNFKPTLPSQVRPSDYQSDLDNRCVWRRYEKEGVRATWIFIMTSPVYRLRCGGHTQVRLSGLQELGREEGGSELIAHIRDIQESAGSRQLDRWRCFKPWYDPSMILGYCGVLRLF